MRYVWLTVRHKVFVFIAGLWTKANLWDLIKHDWSKFIPSELPHYQRQFFGKADDPNGFMNAWLHHQNLHVHHWEYWIPRTGHNRCNPKYLDNQPIPMTERAVREMIADWLGASRVYEGKYPDVNNWKWFDENWESIKPRLHKTTIKRIETVINELKGGQK